MMQNYFRMSGVMLKTGGNEKPHVETQGLYQTTNYSALFLLGVQCFLDFFKKLIAILSS
jgi:hypothetical protein